MNETRRSPDRRPPQCEYVLGHVACDEEATITAAVGGDVASSWLLCGVHAKAIARTLRSLLEFE